MSPLCGGSNVLFFHCIPNRFFRGNCGGHGRFQGIVSKYVFFLTCLYRQARGGYILSRQILFFWGLKKNKKGGFPLFICFFVNFSACFFSLLKEIISEEPCSGTIMRHCVLVRVCIRFANEPTRFANERTRDCFHSLIDIKSCSHNRDIFFVLFVNKVHPMLRRISTSNASFCNILDNFFQPLGIHLRDVLESRKSILKYDIHGFGATKKKTVATVKFYSCRRVTFEILLVRCATLREGDGTGRCRPTFDQDNTSDSGPDCKTGRAPNHLVDCNGHR